MKYDPDGNVLWQLEIPHGQAYSLAQMRDGGYIFGGSYGTGDSEAFHLIKTEPEVAIILQPWNPVIPATGGWLHYGAQVSNILVAPTPLEAWIIVTGPNGSRSIINQFPVTLQPGATFIEPQINVFVPASSPPGDYLYEVHLGIAPPDDPPGGASGSRNMGLGSFTFTKAEP